MSFYAGFVTGVLVMLGGFALTLAAIAIASWRASRRATTSIRSTGVAPPIGKVQP